MNIKGDPVPISLFDIEKLSLRPPEKNDFGMKSFLNYSRGPTRIALPALRTPFGAKIGSSSFGSKIEVNLAFDDAENNEDTRVALQKLEAIDAKIKELVRGHLAAFFPKLNISPDEVESRYKSIIQKDPNYPPRIKLYIESDRENPEKLLSWVAKPLLKAYDGSEIPATRSTIAAVLPPNTVIRSVIEVAHVFASPGRGEVSVKWRLSHAKFNTPPASNGQTWDFDDDAYNVPPNTPAQQADTDGDGQADVDDEGYYSD
jgi:hypothetical protein